MWRMAHRLLLGMLSKQPAGGRGNMEGSHYPIPRAFCGAKTRTGGSCRQPAMKNGRCRMHGGKSLSGKEHGRYKHGQFTKEALEARRQFSELLRLSQKLLRQLQDG
jgi:hypothetical protein